jgi:hypothetical protein
MNLCQLCRGPRAESRTVGTPLVGGGDISRRARAKRPRRATRYSITSMRFSNRKRELPLLAVECDPQLVVLHMDRQGREPVVFDAMEPIRPRVDDYALGILQQTTFQRGDFFERHDGNCRLMPALAQPLALTVLRWRKLVAPIAENLADAFVRAIGRASAAGHVG